MGHHGNSNRHTMPARTGSCGFTYNNYRHIDQDRGGSCKRHQVTEKG